jgi:hypothetical protein
MTDYVTWKHWSPWVEHGPEQGFTARIALAPVDGGQEPGLEIRGINGHECDGFFPFAELELHHFASAPNLGPEHIACIAQLIWIKDHRGTAQDPCAQPIPNSAARQ